MRIVRAIVLASMVAAGAGACASKYDAAADPSTDAGADASPPTEGGPDDASSPDAADASTNCARVIDENFTTGLGGTLASLSLSDGGTVTFTGGVLSASLPLASPPGSQAKASAKIDLTESPQEIRIGFSLIDQKTLTNGYAYLGCTGQMTETSNVDETNWLLRLEQGNLSLTESVMANGASVSSEPREALGVLSSPPSRLRITVDAVLSADKASYSVTTAIAGGFSVVRKVPTPTSPHMFRVKCGIDYVNANSGDFSGLDVHLDDVTVDFCTR